MLARYHRPALEQSYRPTLQLGIRDFYIINFFFLSLSLPSVRCISLATYAPRLEDI